MAKISNTLSYPNQSPIEGADYLIGTAANSTPIKKQTKTFTLQGIASFVIDTLTDGNAYKIPVFTATADGDISFKLVNSIIKQDFANGPDGTGPQEYKVTGDPLGGADFNYTDCQTGQVVQSGVGGGQSVVVCSLSQPAIQQGSGTVELVDIPGSLITIENSLGRGSLLVSEDVDVGNNLDVQGDVSIGGRTTLGTELFFSSSEVYDVDGLVGSGEQVLVSQPDGTVRWENYQGSGLEFQAAWDARNIAEGGVTDGGNPDLLAIPLVPANTGKYWVCNTHGNAALPDASGGTISDWDPGDWAIISEDIAGNVFWDKIDSANLNGSGQEGFTTIWESTYVVGKGFPYLYNAEAGVAPSSNLLQGERPADYQGTATTAYGVGAGKALADNYDPADPQRAGGNGLTLIGTNAGASLAAKAQGILYKPTAHTLVGAYAGEKMTYQAGGVTAIGYEALKNFLPTPGFTYFNVALGANAGQNLVEGNTNIFLGTESASHGYDQAGNFAAITDADGCIVVGRSSKLFIDGNAESKYQINIDCDGQTIPKENNSVNIGQSSTSNQPTVHTRLHGSLEMGNNVQAPASYAEPALAFGTNVDVANNSNFALGYNLTLSTASSFNFASGRGLQVLDSSGFNAVFGNSNELSGSSETNLVSGDSNTITDGSGCGIIGWDSSINGGVETSFILGNTTTVTANDAFAAGFSHTVSADGGMAIGGINTVEGVNAVAIGSNCQAKSEKSFAIGDTAIAQTGTGPISIGKDTTASGTHAIAMGNNSVSSSGNSVSIGTQTIASGPQAVAMGNQAAASGENSVAIGQEAEAGGVSSFALGYKSKATGLRSVALGPESLSSGVGSLTHGEGSSSNASYSVALGFDNDIIEDAGVGHFTVGSSNNVNDIAVPTPGDGNFAIGNRNNIAGNAGAIGEDNTININVNNTGRKTIIIGNDNNAQNLGSIIVGNGLNQVTSDNSVVLLGGGSSTRIYSNQGAAELARFANTQIRFGKGVTITDILANQTTVPAGSLMVGPYSANQSMNNASVGSAIIGAGNTIQNATYSAILGEQNVIDGTNSTGSSVRSHVVGYQNTMTDTYSSFIAGGQNDITTDNNAFALGFSNTLGGDDSMFSFGENNTGPSAAGDRNSFTIGGQLQGTSKCMNLGFRNNVAEYPTPQQSLGLGDVAFSISTGLNVNTNSNALLITEGGINAGNPSAAQVPRVILPTVPTFSASNDAAADAIGVPEGGLYQDNGVVRVNRGGGSTSGGSAPLVSFNGTFVNFGAFGGGADILGGSSVDWGVEQNTASDHFPFLIVPGPFKIIGVGCQWGSNLDYQVANGSSTVSFTISSAPLGSVMTDPASWTSIGTITTQWDGTSGASPGFYETVSLPASGNLQGLVVQITAVATSGFGNTGEEVEANLLFEKV
jgi:hypothetical protein